MFLLLGLDYHQWGNTIARRPILPSPDPRERDRYIQAWWVYENCQTKLVSAREGISILRENVVTAFLFCHEVFWISLCLDKSRAVITTSKKHNYPQTT